MISTRLWLTGFLLGAVALAGLTGCHRQSGKVVAVIPKGQAHVFWQSVHAGAVQAGKEFGINIEWNGPANEVEYSKQIEIVENFISRRIDGILLAPSERKALVGVIEKAKKET